MNISHLAITIRNTHERPEGFDHGTLILSGLKHSKILSSIDIIFSQHNYFSQNFSLVDDYREDNVSSKILRIVFSYIEYVKKNVWKIDI